MPAVSRLLGAACVLVLSLHLGACATVTRGTKEALVIETDPVGATVEVSGQTATTPASFKLSRKFEGTVTISKEGFETVTVQIRSQVATAGGVGMAGNALIGGLIGAGIDVATGSTNELKPNPIKVSLVPLKAAGDPVPAVATEPAAEPAPASPTPVAQPEPAPQSEDVAAPPAGASAT